MPNSHIYCKACKYVQATTELNTHVLILWVLLTLLFLYLIYTSQGLKRPLFTKGTAFSAQESWSHLSGNTSLILSELRFPVTHSQPCSGQHLRGQALLVVQRCGWHGRLRAIFMLGDASQALFHMTSGDSESMWFKWSWIHNRGPQAQVTPLPKLFIWFEPMSITLLHPANHVASNLIQWITLFNA